MSDPREPQDPPEIEEELPPGEPEEGDEPDAPEEGAEGDGDEGEGDADAQGALAAPEKPRKQTANERIRKINADLQRERELRIQAEARAAARQELQQHQSAQQQAAEAAEEARLVQAMTPEERAVYQVAKQQKQFGTQMQQMQAQLFDSNDRAAFYGRYGADPRFSGMLDDIETDTQRMRNQGIPVTREAVLKFKLGERAMSAPARKQVNTQRQQATDRRVAAQGNTRGGRSDTGRQAPRAGTVVQRMEMENGAV